tara:strand:- start:157 stop:411 length:255 start_codon:yes stop_codon:yes gene_type:complete
MPFIYLVQISDEAEMKQADLTSQINGSSQEFTVPENYKSGSLRVYFNGIRQEIGISISESGSNTFTTSFTPLSGDSLSLDYQPQ